MDEITRLTVRVIELESAIEKLNKSLNELAGLKKLAGELDLRIKILEEARQRQIKLNEQLLAPAPKKGVWDLFRK